MTALFFYGTLRCVPLLEIVLGRSLGPGDLEPGTVEGHGVYWVRGRDFPIILPGAGATAPGLLLRAASAEDVARLEYYEGGFDYDLRPVPVRTGSGEAATAQVFFPRPDTWQAGAPWSYEDWHAAWGRITLRAAEEAMAWYGRITAKELAARFAPMRGRAGAWVAAQDRAGDPARDLARDVEVSDHRRAYANYIAVEEMDLRFRRHDGRMSAPVTRGALMVGHAAILLPYDPVRDRVLLIEQFRAPLYMAGDPAPWLWEPVAGMVDPGESPEQTAHREAREEAGLTLARLERAGGVYTSAGVSGEFHHLFVAIADLDGADGGGGGLSSEGEDILARTFGFEELMAGVDQGRLRNIQLVTLALWLARHRDRLRAAA